ncbi:MAG TPA: alpha/beta hydrolase [Candidatus Saccharimonadia bacterium]|jgi:pimeloyl-ACP methyl ester carboxylesterase
MSTVASKDGTKIAFDKSGSGPALILVSGATGYRDMSYGNELVKLLEPHFTVFDYDRRGRGESGDTQPFALEREIEDIQALIREAGGEAFVYGISSGGALVLETALKLGPNMVKSIAVYEAPYDDSKDGNQSFIDYYQNLQMALKAGDRERAIKLFMTLVGVPEPMIEGMKQSPMWSRMLSIAPTLAYDAEAMGGRAGREVPVEKMREMRVPALIMDGEASRQQMPFMADTADKLAAAIPGAKRRTLPGQTHAVDAKVLAPALIEYFSALVSA